MTPVIVTSKKFQVKLSSGLTFKTAAAIIFTVCPSGHSLGIPFKELVYNIR
jgi:hypothetical protein